jgi:hypothetical protein
MRTRTTVAAIALVAIPALIVRAEDVPPPIITPPRPVLPTAPVAPALGAPEPPTCADLATCQALLTQAIAELEHWRGLAPSTPSGIPPVIEPSVELPRPAAVMAASAGSTPEPRPSPAPASAAAEAPVPLPNPDDMPRIAQAAELLKGMKPRDAAEVVAGLDEGFAVSVLSRIPTRLTAPLMAGLEPKLAARLLTRLAQLPARPVEGAQAASDTEGQQ